MMRSFASDNYAGVHPAVLAAIGDVNADHARPYGADEVTERATALLRNEFGEHAEVAFVFNGTGANVLGLRLMLRPWEHVVCAQTAHINVDEGGAPEQLLGSKLVDLPTPDGKLTPELLHSVHTGVRDEHRTQPKVVSVTQSTELGTVYTPHQLRALADTAHELGLYLHLDGSRLANAAASLGCTLRETTTDVGVDVLSLGGTKNGILGAEAVVVLAPELAPALPYARKQLMQLGSKGRYLAAQFVALFTDELWRRNALHANAMAARLHDAVADVPGVRVTRAREANAVFAALPEKAVEPLQEISGFYVWDEATTEVRWMCAWDTRPQDVDTFADAVAQIVPRFA